MPTKPTIECIGPCLLAYKAASIGHTYGPVNFIDKVNTVASMVSAKGSTKRKKYAEGEEVAVECSLAELDIQNLLAVRAGAAVRGTAQTSLAVKTVVGHNLTDDAGVLIIKPVVDGVASADAQDWLYIPRASVEVDANVTFDATGQKVYKVRFEGHPVLEGGIAAVTTGDFKHPAFLEDDLYVWGMNTAA